LKEYFEEWKKHYQVLKTIRNELSETSSYPLDKSYLTRSLSEYKNAMRNHKIEAITKSYVAKIKEKRFIRKMAERLYRQLKKKELEFNSNCSFYEVSGIKNTQRFYFCKAQTHLLHNMLTNLASNFNWQDTINSCTRIEPSTDYLSIRLVDPQTFEAKRIYTVLTSFLWPSMKAIVLKKKPLSKTKAVLFNIKPLYYIKNKNKCLTE
jgi:hypothetical protein